MAPSGSPSDDVRIPAAGFAGRGETLVGSLIVPPTASALIVFAHGAGSSRRSPRNTAVAAALRQDGSFGTLLFDLLTVEEDADYRRRFDIDLLTARLTGATEWLIARTESESMPIGYFGASTGAAAALLAAVRLPDSVKAIVSRGGRPDLAFEILPAVMAPTLLIVGGHDPQVSEMNRQALRALGGIKELAVVPGATHLFEEPGALEQVSALALRWFQRHLPLSAGSGEADGPATRVTRS